MKSIVLAEKPSVGKEIARVLQCSPKGKGYCEGAKYIVTWGLGHLVSLADPDDYDKRYRNWEIEDLPMLPKKMEVRVMSKTSHQFRVVRNLMKRSDASHLVIATDAGREGELVARWIMKAVGWKKPCSRLWISSQTDQAIREGFQNLRPGKDFENLYEAAVCRSEADWLIGMNVTRALTCKFEAQLNAGRVQTPTLYMVVKREQEIAQFTPVPYWTVRVDFDGYFGSWRDKSGNGRIFDCSKAEKIREQIKDKSATIREVKSQLKKEPSPLAYDLTELQRDANRRYSYSAKKTLSLLQALYERHKLVTYPRTDSRHITEDMVPTLTGRLQAMNQAPYLKFAQKILQNPLKPGKRFVDNHKVSDHHAIIPTEQPLKLENLSSEERKIYDLIAKRFLAILYPPYQYDQLTLVTEIDSQRFYSRGKFVRSLGWKEVTSVSLSDDETSVEELPEQTLGQYKEGALASVKKIRLEQGKTDPPPRYTEASLLGAMENPSRFIQNEKLRESIKQGGLGTPATRAEILEKLFYNNYMERRGKQILPTSKGKQIVELVPETLRSPELTAKWERRLENISKGKESSKAFMEDIRKNTISLVQAVKVSTSTFEADNISKTKCPLCSQFMLTMNSKKGVTLVCPDRACGHRQSEKSVDIFDKRSLRQEKRQNKALISKYSDKGNIGTNLGDLLKAALDKKKED